MKPISLNPLRNAASTFALCEPAWKYPIVGTGGCCARAASGHAAALPTSVMNARRFIRSPRRRAAVGWAKARCSVAARGQNRFRAVPTRPRFDMRFCPPYRASFEHLVGATEQRDRDGEAKGLGGLEIDDQVDFRRLLDRQIRRHFALEN